MIGLDELARRIWDVSHLTGSFRLRSGTLDGVVILHADSSRLVATAGGKTHDIPWSAVHPTQVRDMTFTLLGREHRDLLGLAVFFLRNGEKKEARDLLEELKGTDLEIPSRQFLKELDKP